jgi:hypothetical protein
MTRLARPSAGLSVSKLFPGGGEGLALLGLVGLVALAAIEGIGHSRLAVSATPGEAPPSAALATRMDDDTQLALSVRAALIADPEIRSQHLLVLSEGGRIRIMGQVDGPVQAAHAAWVATAMYGVHRVDNQLVSARAAPKGSGWRDTLIAQSNTTRGK